MRDATENDSKNFKTGIESEKYGKSLSGQRGAGEVNFAPFRRMRNTCSAICEYLDDLAGKGLDITPQGDRMAELLSSGSESCVLFKVDMEE